MIAGDYRRDTFAHACLVMALTLAGATDEAVAASGRLLAPDDAVDNPHVVSAALFAYGLAHRDLDANAARNAFSRALAIARDSGNRWIESLVAVGLSMLTATYGDPADACQFLKQAIRNYYEAGAFSQIHTSLAILAVLLDRLGRYESAATISGVAVTPLTRTAYTQINSAIGHLREVLGSTAYKSFARAGQNMTNAAMATYALDQIDRARADLL